MKIKYAGPAKDYSGYGEANRHDIAALVDAGHVLTTQIPIYTLELSDYGKLGELASSLENVEIGYRIKILHTTPNVYKQFYEPGKYHIGRVFWETDKVPLDFAINIEQFLDEVWTGSEHNKKALIAAGVTKPIFIIPEAIDTETEDFAPYKVDNQSDFKFYSIFEWTERKNPTALLEAYFKEFQNDANVSLTIKTYVDNFTPEKNAEIRQYIKKIKARLNLQSYPPLYMTTRLMDRRQVYRFHATFDCFVSAHRGEGWGIPQMEAMLMGKPIISTNCGGIHEYLTDKKDALLVSHKPSQVNNTRNQQWYTPDQNWASVNVDELRKKMRWVYQNQHDAKMLGLEGKKTVENKFSLHEVGRLMTLRLKEISVEMEGDDGDTQ